MYNRIYRVVQRMCDIIYIIFLGRRIIMISKTKVFSVLRNILGGILAFIGIAGIIAGNVLAGIFMILSGVAVLPLLYQKTKLNKIKYIQIILPISLLMITILCIAKNNPIEDTSVEIKTTTSAENQEIEIDKLQFTQSNLELDVKETKNIILEIFPENAVMRSMDYQITDEKIATVEKTDSSNESNKLVLSIKPLAEGECELFVKSENGVESNKVTIKVTDEEKAKAEQEAKKRAEQEAKKESERTSQTKSNESSKPQTTSKSSAKKTQSDTQKSKTQQSNSDDNNGRTIYRTPSGKRYHYDPNCGGKNSYPTTLSQAQSAGLTPCKKCVH